MKPTLRIISAIIILFPFIARAQLTDTSVINRLTINGFCLCKTTVSDLKQSYNDIKEVSIEEMDLAKGCIGEDSRFVAGTGYASDKQPGVIFQKDPQSDFISKIRLTNQFKGNLPDGQYVNLSNFLLKDLFKLYPALKENWQSRGCSSFWRFSNDTISFYVKIDKSKQPQFPIDKAYYLNKKVAGVDIAASCARFQENKTQIEFEDNNDAIFFIDSIRINKTALQSYTPNEIASITVYKDLDATKRIASATNGLIYIETKNFARERYWKYFKSKSEEYAKIVQSPENDTTIQYILNKRILRDNIEGDLSAIDDTVFKGIQIIDKKALEKKYHIFNKEYGIIILADPPKNLYNRKK